MIMTMLKRGGALVLLATFLTACGDDVDNATGTALPERPEDHIVEGTRSPERVITDPTPDTSTGGGIPNYDTTDGEGTDARTEGN